MEYAFVTYLLVSLFFCGSTFARNPLSTHILDISEGKPAPGVTVGLYFLNTSGSSWLLIKELQTDIDGRIEDFILETDPFLEGTYKLVFQTKEYFQRKNLKTFYPYIEVAFEVANSSEHYHVPILLSAYGFSTYRGS